MPLMWSKSQCRRTGPTPGTELVDYQLTWPGRGDHLLERAATIGEFKKPSAIEYDEWLGRYIPTPLTVALQKDIRGYVIKSSFSLQSGAYQQKRYAYHYDCPQVFIYDSIYLVIVQFKALNREEIKHPQCSIDCWVIPRQLLKRHQCTIQYGLYQLAWRGWMRLSATLEDGSGGEKKAIARFY